MPYSPFPVSQFGGLNLQLEPDEADIGPNGAIDLLNVDLNNVGAIRSRYGYTQFSATGPAGTVQFVKNWPPGNGVVLADAAGVQALNSAGASVATSVYTNAIDAALYGTPTASFMFLSRDPSGTALLRYDGTTFATPAYTGTAPSGIVVGVTPWDNRLVNAARGGTTSGDNNSTVRFSDPGNPLNWPANNFVDLTPGDTGSITAIATWREFVLVFKQNKFFTFTAPSTDGSGNPIFNYRPVAATIGANGPRSVVSAPDGVYFIVEGDGLYKTTGGTPIEVSATVRPLFRKATMNGIQPYFLGSGQMRSVVGTNYPTSPHLAYHRGRLYIGYTDGTVQRTLIYDIGTEEWFLWDWAADGFATHIDANPFGTSLLFVKRGTVGVQEYSPAATTDAGAAISSRYRSGFFNPLWVRKHGRWLTQPSLEAKIRETVLHGQGTPTFSLARDYAIALPTTGGGAKSAVTLGAAPSRAQGRHRLAQRARVFSYQVEGTSPWLVDDLTFHIAGQRAPGVEDGNP